MPDDLPPSLLQLLQRSIPTYQAAEVLLFFASHPELELSVEEIVVAMRPVVITVPAARQYATLFSEHGLLRHNNGRFAYGPTTPVMEAQIGALADAYNERPVTLIRAIYTIADTKIQSFAESFRLRKIEP